MSILIAQITSPAEGEDDTELNFTHGNLFSDYFLVKIHIHHHDKYLFSMSLENQWLLPLRRHCGDHPILFLGVLTLSFMLFCKTVLLALHTRQNLKQFLHTMLLKELWARQDIILTDFFKMVITYNCDCVVSSTCVYHV